MKYIYFQIIHNKLEVVFKRINIKTVNIIFILGTIIVLISHTLFSVGLYDGTDYLFYMILNNGFHFLELSRTLFKVLQLLPAYLLIKFSSFSSLSLLAPVFSFGLIWIHIISFFGCYFILPRNKKNLIFFPLFAFFIGPVISFSVSISVALSVCSYVWLLAYIIYYSDLSKKAHRVLLFLVPLPLLLSHELMSYMAWPLIVLCWYKNKTEKNLFNKKLLWFVKIYLFFTSFVQTVMILWHDAITDEINDLNGIIDSIVNLDFLFKPSLNFLIILPLLICFYYIIFFYKSSLNLKKNLNSIILILLTFLIFVVFIASVFQIQEKFIPDYNIRFYPPIIALPYSLFLWWIHERKKADIEKSAKIFLCFCIFFCVTFVFFRLSTDYRFHKYQIKISEQVTKCKGVIKWEKFKDSVKDTVFNYKLLNWHEWQIYYLSLLYPRSNFIKSIVLPSVSPCMERCKRNLYKDCEKRCVEEQLSLFHKLALLHIKGIE